MPPDLTSLGPGLAGGGGLLGLAWIADKLWGKGSRVAAQVAELHAWHAVNDPDDSTQKIWWLSMRIRESIAATPKLLQRFVDGLEEQNRALGQLVDVAAQQSAEMKDIREGMDEIRRWMKGAK